MTTLAEKLFKKPVSEPDRSKIEYQYTVGKGWWAYLTEAPTIRAHGEQQQSAYRNLLILLASTI